MNLYFICKVTEKHQDSFLDYFSVSIFKILNVYIHDNIREIGTQRKKNTHEKFKIQLAKVK